jgi:AcrR family transcriptional regulator
MTESPETQPIFPRLASGPRKMEAEAVARHQRGRLQRAMVELVSTQGFEQTTLRELVALAGVSKSTFYEHFESKQDCFLCTFDDIVDEFAARIDSTLRPQGDLRGNLKAGLDMFAALSVELPAMASLVAVESLTLGAAAVPNRERASERFERLISREFERSPSARPVSDLTVRGIVAGIRNCAYQSLREGDEARLPTVVDPLVGWILAYDRPAGEPARRAAEVFAREASESPPLPPPAAAERGGDERTGITERIALTAAELAVEKGYESLSIPAISAAAGVSNKTFYDHFPGKREAFMAGFDALAQEVLVDVAGSVAGEGDRATAIGAGLRALLRRSAEDGLFARLAFFELPMAGPQALDHADRTLGGFAGFLGPPESEGGLPEVVKESIVGGTWAILQHELASGRGPDLLARGPEFAQFVLAPFGAEEGGG